MVSPPPVDTAFTDALLADVLGGIAASSPGSSPRITAT
jgi:hypothetical protein